ncbi:MCE family protein [Hoyosella sp. G463]|uniref:MCE family protein n=1 Tax=Lolliginicoccus lacisalsi TaxID=2742202 RepID=A0A927PM62_9ACTN|nr:MCE family protein [Lolliginicoccus lacisalsi]MBD8507920.1 MCE family protein [Lolliginicoccus lacisalsi]
MRRSTKIQLALFIAMALFIIPFGTRYALGAQFLSLGTIGLGDRPTKATAYFDDGRGLGPGTVVTYQGVVIGKVQEIKPVPPEDVRRVQTDDGEVVLPVQVDFQLDPGIEVPGNVTPASTILNVAGLVNLELRPQEGGVAGDTLADGDELIVDPTLQRVSFREVLVSVNEVVDTLDVESLNALLTMLGDTFTGRGDDIGDIIDNVGELADVFDKHGETVDWLGTEGPATMALIADASDTMPSSFATFNTWTRQLIEARPDLEALIDTGPGSMRRVADLIASNEAGLDSMMDGWGDVLPVLGDREPALQALVNDFPAGLREVAGIAPGGVARFDLVVTQGPACYYETTRRAVADTSDRESNKAVFCPPGPDLAQRGAATAPRPNGLGLVGYTSPGLAAGPVMVSDPLILGPASRAALDGMRNAGVLPR